MHEKDANTESIVIVAPYGPLTFIIGPSTVYGAQSDDFVENSIPIVGVANAAPAFAQTVNTLTAAAGTDKGRMRSWHMAGAFTYRNGPVELGTFFTMFVQPNTHFLPFTGSGRTRSA